MSWYVATLDISTATPIAADDHQPLGDPGQRIGDDGQVIPAVYWECFREGRDDARYIYTLQQAAWEREGTDDATCRRLVAEAKQHDSLVLASNRGPKPIANCIKMPFVPFWKTKTTSIFFNSPLTI